MSINQVWTQCFRKSLHGHFVNFVCLNGVHDDDAGQVHDATEQAVLYELERERDAALHIGQPTALRQPSLSWLHGMFSCYWC